MLRGCILNPWSLRALGTKISSWVQLYKPCWPDRKQPATSAASLAALALREVLSCLGYPIVKCADVYQIETEQDATMVP
jgi:hypothetical protein